MAEPTIPPPNAAYMRTQYEAEVGADARERQQRELSERHMCCGERREEGHHTACSRRPKDDPAAVLDGQIGLL